VVPTSMKRGQGKKQLMVAIAETSIETERMVPAHVDYKEMEPYLDSLIALLRSNTDMGDKYPIRWMAIKLMEGDEAVLELVKKNSGDGLDFVAEVNTFRKKFEDAFDTTSESHVATCRYAAAEAICRPCVKQDKVLGRRISDRIDDVVCHKWLGPIFMLGVLWLLYYFSIVQGYNLTNYTWPLLAKLRNFTAAVMPDPGFIDIPLIRSFALWLVDSVNALLNYIPIFFILFAFIAFLEDSGYMPRMAFIMDRLFGRYGLHGQSTLPMVLGGIYVGGCAVPGVMACKGIPDERSRLATILIIPLLNCLAKVPLYVLLINIYFADHKGLAMFFISTISLLLILPISKLLTMTVLKNKETAPFVMEMPPYHMPTFRGVLGRALERVWMFIRKITTIVVALAVVIFILLQFPGITKERMVHYNSEKGKAIKVFQNKIKGTPYEDALAGENLMSMVNYWESYKNKKMTTKGAEANKVMKDSFKDKNPVFFAISQPGKDKIARKVNRAFKKMYKSRKRLLRKMKSERIDRSFLGRLGKSLVPVTKWAGFNWRVNVSLLSAFAAKESAVATLGALYEQDESGESLEDRMAKGESGFTPLHALALMMFMVLYPPCLAASIAVKLQSGSSKWMLFGMGYPMLLGIIVATLIFTGGRLLNLTGLQAMFVFYFLALFITIIIGSIKPETQYQTKH